MICWKCGKEYEGEIHRTTTCDCGADLHSCYNCKFYSEGSHYDCSETVDDIVTDKERSNFCDYFSAGKNPKNKARYENSSSGAGTDKAQSAKDAFNSLFGGL